MKFTIKNFAHTLKMWLCTALAFVVLFASVVIALMSTPYSSVANLHQTGVERELDE